MATHTKLPITTCNYSSRGSESLFWPLWVLCTPGAHITKQALTYTKTKVIDVGSGVLDAVVEQHAFGIIDLATSCGVSMRQGFPVYIILVVLELTW